MDTSDGYVSYEEFLYIKELCLGNELRAGMKFKSKTDLIHIVKLWHIKKHYDFQVIESNKKVPNVVFKEKDTCNCKWRLCTCQKC